MGRSVEFPWGEGSITIPLPDQWRLLGELRPRTAEASSDPAASCAEALSTPISSQRLASRNLEGKRVLVVVDDHSRPTPISEFIGPVLEELAQAGVADADISILIATGVHRPSRPEEVERKLGREIMSRFSWQCHDAYDSNGLVSLGSTTRGTKVFLNRLLMQSDLVVCMGAVEPHLLVGFGGGLKTIIPGCAGAETIGKNHLQGVDPDNFDAVGVHGDHSPMREDLEEGALLSGRELFIVNAAMNEEARPTKFFCGDPFEAHRAGEQFVESLVRLEVPEQADVVLANSFPMDLDLRQSAKCLGNSLHACKPGGVMLGCLRSEHGLGEVPLAKKTLPYPVMRTLLKVIGKHRVLPLVKKAKAGEPVEEVFIAHFGLQMMRRNNLGIFSDSPKLPPDVGRKMGLARSFNNVEVMMNWAAGRAPRRATVWAFPCGGSTYANRRQSSQG